MNALQLKRNLLKVMIITVIATLMPLINCACNEILNKYGFKYFKSNYNILIPKKSFNINKHIDAERKIITIQYSIHKNYAADELILFYNAIMTNHKYEPYYSEKINLGEAKWQKFIDDTKTGHPVVFQYSKMWIGKQEHYIILLLLQYYDYSIDIDKVSSFENIIPKNDEVHVTLQIMPQKDFVY